MSLRGALVSLHETFRGSPKGKSIVETSASKQFCKLVNFSFQPASYLEGVLIDQLGEESPFYGLDLENGIEDGQVLL